ncbi:hypothetical protein HRG_011549 [Hirsutella rhossiliensis]|uniref:Uncharacterized protein n=1 Tax=Hirsutella rhossiliensis TaxID=111463 RepID=A0A9P8MQJ5_9HYPO|nr:uncharacterized protein HRG_11549 [Hirsutella rhossiliensis]KAH0957402.1 hypothetical protein HRG_11549 [Hirsutella rhossiliensis]
MCQNVRHYVCGHMQKRRTTCYKTGHRRSAGGGLAQIILDFFFPPPAVTCDRMTGEVRPVKGPCPACARLRKQALASDGGKPLPQLPASAKMREAYLAKMALYDQDPVSPKLKKERSGKRRKERSSVDGAQKSVLNRWGIEYLLKSRNRGSVDSDRSWVSPAARRIENGEIDIWTPCRNDKDVITSWI